MTPVSVHGQTGAVLRLQKTALFVAEGYDGALIHPTWLPCGFYRMLMKKCGSSPLEADKEIYASLLQCVFIGKYVYF